MKAFLSTPEQLSEMEAMQRRLSFFERKMETMESILRQQEKMIQHQNSEVTASTDASSPSLTSVKKGHSQNSPPGDRLQISNHASDSNSQHHDLELGMKSSRRSTNSTKSKRSRCNGSSAANPFEKRRGKKLTWSNVNMVLNKDGNKRKLIDNMWGQVPSKKITAIMGPSGGGKTSLLNILSGRASTRGNITIDATIKLDQYRIDPTKIEVRRTIAFVAQEESLPVTATPREAIAFSARLRLPRTTSKSDIEKLTNTMLKELGLSDCADALIGGGLVKGISGGQKKRVSVGVELVVKPTMVFLDEPTSGLDYFSAAQLVNVLKKVAQAGASVLFTIHQPASDVFQSFDHLILLKEGRVMFEGSIKSIPSAFARCNAPIPQHFNPADWIIQVAQSLPVNELEKSGFFPPRPSELESKKLSKGERIKDALGIGGINFDDHVSPLVELKMLLQREATNIFRNKLVLVTRVGVALFSAVVSGIIYWKIGERDQTNFQYVQSQLGGIVMVLMIAMFCTAQSTLLEFPAERPIFVREYSTNHYSVTTYFIARLLTEAIVTFVQISILVVVSYTMMAFRMKIITYFLANYILAMAGSALGVLLGCAVDDVNIANQMLPIIFVPQMLLAGFFVLPELIPIWLRWVQFVCALTYALRITVGAELSLCPDDAKFLCDTVASGLGADSNRIFDHWLILGGLFVMFRLGALFLLQRKATIFF